LIERRTSEQAAQLVRRAIFLSASVPELRPWLAGEAARENQLFYNTRKLPQIREALAELCRFAFRHEIQLVFGGHPQISPLVLAAARQFSDPGGPLVFVYQSLWYEQQIPVETRELGNWSRGVLVETPRQNTEDASLLVMRNAMVDLSALLCGVFIGGMSGVIEEAKLFQKTQHKKCFALSETGSAAEALVNRGIVPPWRPQNPAAAHSFPLLMQELFAEIGVP
jgi:hypothetical protein